MVANLTAAYTEDSAVQGAVFRAFYNLASPASFECPTNCTWDQDHISLGFGTVCKDVTAETYATQNCTKVDSSDNGEQNCTMTTPGGVNFHTLEVPTDWSTILLIQAKSLYNETKFSLVSTDYYLACHIQRSR